MDPSVEAHWNRQYINVSGNNLLSRLSRVSERPELQRLPGVHQHLHYQTASSQGSQAIMKRKPTITCWCGQHHRNTYAADRNGKVHTRSSTAQMTICVYCGTSRWRYASRQELCEKCGRFPPREAKPA